MEKVFPITSQKNAWYDFILPPNMAGKLFIGTSGWNYKHWVGRFYPEQTPASQFLSYYLKFFQTVELNNSFYMLPAKQTFIKWKNAVPEYFIFSVKANRYITHMKKLKDPESIVEKFMDHVSGLEEKLGPVLFQLPPGWKINEERLKEFLEVLPAGKRYAFEFRNRTWYDKNIFTLLKKHNCAFCIYELNGHLSPLEVSADFVYVRLHGPGAKYEGSYSDEILKQWASRCKQWLKEKKDVYFYFDNDQNAYAAFNAQRLKELCDKSEMPEWVPPALILLPD
jgi:uncharacterized protein YecE (DUF72 family)